MPKMIPGTVSEKAAAAKGVLSRYKPQMEVMSPRGAPPAEHLLALAYFAIGRDAKLAECTGQSLVAATLESVSLGLRIGMLGHCWLVPFKDQATLIVGYRGMLELAYRSGQIVDAFAEMILEGDDFTFDRATRVMSHNRDLDVDPGSHVRGAFAAMRHRTGVIHYDVMNLAELEKIRRTSKMANAGAWKAHTSEMYKKTVVRRLFKYAPVSAACARASDVDEAADLGFQEREVLQGRILLPESVAACELATEDEKQRGLTGCLPGQGVPDSALEVEGEGPGDDRGPQGSLDSQGSNTPGSPVSACEHKGCPERATVASIERTDSLPLCQGHGG